MLSDSSLQRFFIRQIEKWDDARQRYRDLRNIKTRELTEDNFTLQVQWNPARIVSTGAKIDQKALAERPCFLCEQNRPQEQIKKQLDNQMELLVNPYPILPTHYTIPTNSHQPQRIEKLYGEIHQLLTDYPELMVFYNGPQCGASAPDHAHLQAGTNGILPLQTAWQRLTRNLTLLASPTASEANSTDEGIYAVNDYPCPALLIRSHTPETDKKLFIQLYKALDEVPQLKEEASPEPMMNIVSWRKGDTFMSVVFPDGSTGLPATRLPERHNTSSRQELSTWADSSLLHARKTLSVSRQELLSASCVR